jgi:23S rRNA G2445 N2-methylase RlmL
VRGAVRRLARTPFSTTSNNFPRPPPPIPAGAGGLPLKSAMSAVPAGAAWAVDSRNGKTKVSTASLGWEGAPLSVMTNAHSTLPYFATAAKGTEGLLRDELRALNVRPIRGDRGGVHFGGTLVDAFRVCLHSRIAIRVLELRGQTSVTDSKQLYDFVSSISFDDILDPRLTLAVSASVASSQMTHSQFVSRRVKDAIVDRQRRRDLARSNVDPAHPDVHILVHLAKNSASVYVDLAGDALHRRGYRPAHVTAPLKENVASALVQLSRWDKSSPFCDPCCGSGTIVLEAALIAANFAPGLLRQSFGLERHLRIDQSLRATFESVRETARKAINTEAVTVVRGSDIDIASLSLAKSTATSLNLCIQFARQDVLHLSPTEQAGTIVTNPPYGKRLEGGTKLASRIGRSLSKFKGFNVVVLSPDPAWLTAMGTRPSLEHTLFNGNIECRAFGWTL